MYDIGLKSKQKFEILVLNVCWKAKHVKYLSISLSSKHE